MNKKCVHDTDDPASR